MKALIQKIGLFLIIFVSIGSFIFFFFGITKIWEAFSYINTLDQQLKENSVRQLRNFPKSGVYSGIYSQQVTFNKTSTIWLFNYDGLKKFKTNSNTVFSSFSLCKDERWKNPQQNITKNANMNYQDWQKSLKQGDYIQVITSKEDERNVKEITSYDWWAFSSQIPVNYFQKRC